MLRLLLAAPLATIAISCTDKDPGEGPIVVDIDGDSYEADRDCDDNNADVYPGASELCDGLDNDCDDVIDEGLSVDWYADLDGDGYGDPEDRTEGCETPAGRVADSTDCDDSEATIHPNADEACDEIDNDCDGEIDEDDVLTWYADADGDGYGDPWTPIESCAAVDGYLENADDCDDTEPSAYPGGTEECDDVDNDCDGEIDEDVTSTWYADDDGDGYGKDDETLQACDAPEGYAESPGDCDDDDPAFHPDAVEDDCTDPSDYNCDGSVAYADDDADGFAACEDCDDADASINPSASEICDGTDNDCDGDTDDDDEDVDLSTGSEWYTDADSDDYGDPDTATTACDQPFGHVEDGTDCDDSSDTVNPSASEVCDGADNDCDGDTDDDDADLDPFTRTNWYTDADSDGYGDPDDSTTTCEAPSGTVANAGDCDDTTSEVNPAADEVCNEIDDDCDGTADNDDALDAATWYIDADADSYGDPDTTTTACEAPSGYAENGDDCNDSNARAYLGATEYCDSVDNDCDGTIDNDYALDADLWYADADGDGQGDAETTASSCDEPLGYVDNATDCDDTEPLAFVGGSEICDGSDNDCDGAIDDADDDVDSSTYSDWYIDGDGDGWGSADTVQSACDAPDGFVDNTTDCDDTEPLAWTGATEVCDDVDNDCDGATDSADGDVDLSSQREWWADTDGDGYGDPDSNTAACEQPSGYIADSTDCDDADASINPSASEVCDGTDNDCDGDTDDDDEDVDLSTGSEWYTDADSDGYGATTTTVACVLPPGHSENSDDCDDADADISPGATEVCGDGVDDDCDGDIDEECPTEHCGVLTADETWSGSSLHQVTCSVYVRGGTLTIEDGVDVAFDPETTLYVGDASGGALVISGSSEGVTLTSSESTPAAGDWGGVSIGAFDGGSSISGATIEYGGGNGYGNVLIYDADVQITDSVLRSSSQAGLHVIDGIAEVSDSSITGNATYGVYVSPSSALEASGGPTFVGNVLSENGGYPIGLPGGSVGQLDASSSFTGNTTDLIQVLDDTLEEDATWSRLDADYFIDGSIAIEGASNPTLAIDDGVTLYFAASTGLTVGDSMDGALAVPGTGVTFTSAESIPAPGDWDGITFGAYDQGSELRGATVEYAGGNGYGNIYALYASPEITGCTVSDSSTSGIYVSTSAAPLISGTTIRDNTATGVDITTYGGLGGAFEDNTLTGNSGYPIELPASYVGLLRPSSSFTGNGDDQIFITTGTVDVDGTWHDLGVPFLAGASIYVQGSAGPELIIEDNVTVYMESGTDFYVGSGSDGALSVTGRNITFTSAESSPAPGDWDGITFGAYDQGSELRGVTVEYAGGNGYGNIYLYDADVEIGEATIAGSSTAGVYVYGSSAVQITQSTIRDNVETGVYLHSSSVLTAAFEDNALTGNGGFPIELPANYAGLLDASSTYSGNTDDRINLGADTIDMDADWQDLGVPYYASGSLYVQGSDHPLLTLEDGVEVQFEADAQLYIGNGNYGGLIAADATFTSAQSSPAAGDWEGITMGSYCDASDVVLDDVTVEYGGDNGYGNIYLYSCDATISDSAITDSASWGIYRSSSSPTLSDINYSNNASGDLY